MKSLARRSDSSTGRNKGTVYLWRVQVDHELRENDLLDVQKCWRLVVEARKLDRDREPAPIALDGRDFRIDYSGDATTERDAVAGSR